jgi:biofilm PGA synthesis N-glycosyltransferase PgaC
MTFYFLILFGFYFALLLILKVGWLKAIAKKEIKRNDKTHFISVIIPARNEEKNIVALLKSLENQDYLKTNFEIIVVDDHSTDNSIKKTEESKERFQNLIVFSQTEKENGKKAALSLGIKNAKGVIIATTDADCLLPSDWLATINSIFQDQEITMAAGIVTIADEDNLFSQWQAMEFASVMATSAAAFGLKNPMMCNGANLSFRKEIFYNVNGYEGNEHIASGDDEFLMRKIEKKFPHSIQIVSSIVTTQPQASMKDFLSQRIRWASKWKGNPQITAKFLAVYIFLMQVTWIFFLGTFYTYDSEIVFVLLLLKIVSDIFFLLPVFRFMKIKFRLLPFLGLQFLYPFYVIFVGLLAPWISYQWKDRKIL